MNVKIIFENDSVEWSKAKPDWKAFESFVIQSFKNYNKHEFEIMDTSTMTTINATADLTKAFTNGGKTVCFWIKVSVMECFEQSQKFKNIRKIQTKQKLLKNREKAVFPAIQEQ